MLFQLSLIQETISLEWFAHYKSYIENRICKWRKLFCFLFFSVLIDDLFWERSFKACEFFCKAGNWTEEILISSFHLFPFFL